MRDRVIVCVLKSGAFRPRVGSQAVAYGPEHVIWLRNQFKARIASEHRFVCLSDVDVPGVEVIPLRDDLPGWWSKLEIFREFETAAYVDLDTVAVGDIGCYLFNDHRFTVSGGISIRGPGEINSSVMCWDGDYRWIYDQFIADKHRIMGEYIRNARWGDQAFIRDAALGQFEFELFQQRFPGSIVTYRQVLRLGRPMSRVVHRPRALDEYGVQRLGLNWKDQPRIVFFNGRPKPWQVRQPWIPLLAA